MSTCSSGTGRRIWACGMSLSSLGEAGCSSGMLHVSTCPCCQLTGMTPDIDKITLAKAPHSQSSGGKCYGRIQYKWFKSAQDLVVGDN